MLKNCIDLNFNLHPIPLEDHDELKKAYQTTIKFTRLNQELVSILKSANFYICHVESFRSKPYFRQTIHTDNWGGDYVKINWVYGGKKSLMHWYDVKPNAPIPEKSYTKDTGTEFMRWPIDAVNLIESAEVKFPSIVQVGCPHSITNFEEERLCIAIVIKDSSTHQRVTMEETCKRLASYII
jgi:hypothetical protein